MKQIKIFNEDIYPTEKDFVNVVNTFCECNNVLDITRVILVKNGYYFSSIMVVYESV